MKYKYFFCYSPEISKEPVFGNVIAPLYAQFVSSRGWETIAVCRGYIFT